MEELEKYQLVNSCESAEELKNVIERISTNGVIQGRQKDFSVENQQQAVDLIIKGVVPYNALTRSYGLRQQMMYIIHYGKFEELKTITQTQS